MADTKIFKRAGKKIEKSKLCETEADLEGDPYIVRTMSKRGFQKSTPTGLTPNEKGPRRHEIVELRVFSGKKTKQTLDEKLWAKIQTDYEEYLFDKGSDLVVERSGYAKNYGYIQLPSEQVNSYKKFVCSRFEARAWERWESDTKRLISFKVKGFVVKRFEGEELVDLIAKRNEVPGTLTLIRYTKIQGGDNYALTIELDEIAGGFIRGIIEKAKKDLPKLIVGVTRLPFRHRGIVKSDEEEPGNFEENLEALEEMLQ